MRFFKEKDQIELYSKKQYFKETFKFIELKEKASKILDEMNLSFKVKRILVLDPEFNDYFDVDDNNVFENMQKFKIFCEVLSF